MSGSIDQIDGIVHFEGSLFLFAYCAVYVSMYEYKNVNILLFAYKLVCMTSFLGFARAQRCILFQQNSSFQFSAFSLAQQTLSLWDKQIQGVCLQVNDILEKIQQHVPEWGCHSMDTN